MLSQSLLVSRLQSNNEAEKMKHGLRFRLVDASALLVYSKQLPFLNFFALLGVPFLNQCFSHVEVYY